MTTMGHIAYPSLAFFAAAGYFGFDYNSSQALILAGAAALPDIDFIYQSTILKKGLDKTYDHHMWASHWPITYLPILLLALFTGSGMLALVSYGIFSHLILDSFFCATGVMWLYPFSKKDINLFSSKTAGYHGKMWIRKYKELAVFKLEIIAFFAFLVAVVTKFAI